MLSVWYLLVTGIYECKSVYIDSGYEGDNSARNIVIGGVQNVCIVAKLKHLPAKQNLLYPYPFVRLTFIESSIDY